MVSNPFTNINKVCNPSDSSERRKKAIRLKYGKLIYEGCSWRDISVTSYAAWLKIVPNNNIFFVYHHLTSIM